MSIWGKPGVLDDTMCKEGGVMTYVRFERAPGMDWDIYECTCVLRDHWVDVTEEWR